MSDSEDVSDDASEDIGINEGNQIIAISSDEESINTSDDAIEESSPIDFDKSHIPVVPLMDSIEENDATDVQDSAAKHLAALGVSAFNLEDVERNVIEQVDKAIEEREKQTARKEQGQLTKVRTEIKDIEKVCCLFYA
jgi:hypothetical protein